jgi:hypothetical protein
MAITGMGNLVALASFKPTTVWVPHCDGTELTEHYQKFDGSQLE